MVNPIDQEIKLNSMTSNCGHHWRRRPTAIRAISFYYFSGNFLYVLCRRIPPWKLMDSWRLISVIIIVGFQTILPLPNTSQEQCKSVLDSISHHINNQHSELAGHHLLSIFKMAEMQVVMPEVGGSTRLGLAVEALLVSILLPLLVSSCSDSNGLRIATWP